MINLVGEKGFNGPVVYDGMDELLEISGLHLHLYGKAETRPMRKMGHLTLIGADLETLRKTAKRINNRWLYALLTTIYSPFRYLCKNFL